LHRLPSQITLIQLDTVEISLSDRAPLIKAIPPS